MSIYFEAFNEKRASIDDQFRYLYYVSELNLNSGAQNPDSPSYFNSSYGSAYYFQTLQFNQIDKWMYVQGSPFMSSSSNHRYMCYIKLVEANRLYGIRFKKKCESIDVFIRLCYTGLGAIILKDDSKSAIMVEIMTSDSSAFETANAYLDYFDIVEIGNDVESIPLCTQGIEIYSEIGDAIWNSNCKMLNVLDFYSGEIADGVLYSDWDENKILIPTKTYRNNSMWYTSSYSRTYSCAYRDFYIYDNEGLRNTTKSLQGKRGYHSYVDEKCRVWDPREFGADASKIISGIIAQCF